MTVTGTLKGFDQLMNLVMDDVVEEFESEYAESLPCSILRRDSACLVTTLLLAILMPQTTQCHLDH